MEDGDIGLYRWSKRRFEMFKAIKIRRRTGDLFD